MKTDIVYQAVVTDCRDYILTYETFKENEIAQMLAYINREINKEQTAVIKIKKWEEFHG